MNILYLFVYLLLPVAMAWQSKKKWLAPIDFDNIPCDFPEYTDDVGKNKKETYIIRNHPANPEFKELLTIENIMKEYKDRVVLTFEPQQSPTVFKKAILGPIMKRAYEAYDKVNLNYMINNPEENIRVLKGRFDAQTPLIPEYIFDKFSCGHINDTAPYSWSWDFFIGSRGSSINFHEHNEIYTQMVRGRKLWLLAPSLDYTHNVLGLPKDRFPRDKITEIMNDPNIKKCVSGPNDIFHIPHLATHGVMNLDTTVAYGCVAMHTEEEENWKVNVEAYPSVHETDMELLKYY
jgi:hypothetical protein